jgi:hypothetical protein
MHGFPPSADRQVHPGGRLLSCNLPRRASGIGATLPLLRVPPKVPSPFELRTFTIVRCKPWFAKLTIYALASRLSESWMEARVTKVARVSARFSKSLARRRFPPNQEKVRSTTQRRGRTTKPFMSSLRLTISVRSGGTLATAASTRQSLRAAGIKIAKQRGMARARVAVARKLAVVLHRMWSDKTEFRFGKEPGTPATA